jgi:uncharacterized protein (TIGR02611 family)
MAIQGPREVLRFIGRSGRRVGVTLLGLVLLAAGLVMMVTPGPGIVAILAGLALLATEYAWAEAMLDRVKDRARRAGEAVRRRRRGR